ncbi:hypothetical protein [Rhodococcus rhodnii]|nr:hypothetical protein [Rhodococcus rhodnii]
MSRPGRVTWGWTDLHTGIALCVALAALAGTLGGAQSGGLRVVVLVAAVACVALASAFDGFAGVVVGLAAATGAVVAMRYLSEWGREMFVSAAATAACLVVLGWTSGVVGTRIRTRLRAADSADDALGPAFGSLGMLGEEWALPRLDDEIIRARGHHRDLALLLVRVHPTDPALDDAARSSLCRSVARLVESLSRDADVPFTLADSEFGAILPETSLAAAWGVAGPIVDAARRSTFTDRATGARRGVAECAEVRAGLVALSDHTVYIEHTANSETTEDAAAMLRRARTALGGEVRA